MSVQLIIKSAAQNVEDFALDCELAWTIGQVKEEISNLYPTKPEKQHQKLIYGGKLLPDHLCLKSILNKVQDTHTFHLVCPITLKSEIESSSEKVSESTTYFSAPPSNTVHPQMNQHTISPQSILSGVPQNGSVPSFYTGDSLNQYLAMQQMYSQFMTQYLSQYNVSMSLGVPYVPVTVPSAPVQQPAAIQVQNQNNPNPAPRQHEEDQRDYIDHLYVISRAVMLSAILYYYSSFSRIFMVLTLFLVVSLYVRIGREEQERRRASEREADAANSQQVPADIQTQTSENEEMVSESNEDPVIASEQPQNQRQNVMTFLTNILNIWSLFFSSLIPIEPLPVNAN